MSFIPRQLAHNLHPELCPFDLLKPNAQYILKALRANANVQVGTYNHKPPDQAEVVEREILKVVYNKNRYKNLISISPFLLQVRQGKFKLIIIKDCLLSKKNNDTVVDAVTLAPRFWLVLERHEEKTQFLWS